MIILEQGYLAFREDGQIAACGYVIGHPKVDDGIFINTSYVESVTMEGDELHIHTQSGSHYRLRLADVYEERLGNTKAALKKLGVSFDMGRCRTLIRENEIKMCVELSGILEPCELYLRMLCDETVTHAYYMAENGVITKAGISYHVGTFQDSILIRVYCKCDFRFFPNGTNIEPYHWSDGLQAVKIHNICGDFDFKCDQRRIKCKGKEITTIKAEEYTGEGLVSPDSVTGKSLLTNSWDDIFGK